MPRFENVRKELNDTMSQRANYLAQAEDAQKKGDNLAYKAAMDKVKELNTVIDDKKAIVDEIDRYADAHATKFGNDRRDMQEMGRALAAGERVKIDIVDTLAGIRQNSTTLATGALVAPQGAGANIRDGFAGQVSSLIDQVNTVTLAGMNSWEEPYVVSDMEAQGGKVSTNAGKARTESDPVFAKAKLASYEVNVTSFVDRNISRLSPADYAAKVQTMALRSLRRKINGLIANGDGQASPDMYGFLNAKNTDGKAIYHTLTGVTAIDENTLNRLVFGYGGDEEVGGAARLHLTKANLQAFGALRGINEKQKLYKITVDPGNPNTGTIEDGGLIVPYTIVSALGDKTLAYGDPINYMLALFGDYVIRVDESVKAVERMYAILGDIFVGGNLTVDKGFANATLAVDEGSADATPD